jgi:release factor glutamine methyltransferase
MTYGEVYHKGKSILAGAKNESPAFDAACLMQKVFGLDRQALILRSAEAAKEAQAAEYFRMVGERASGRPLQYILGRWPFLELELQVGEGVLIPREETELLVRTAADYLKNSASPNVIDLCSGTGAVALGLASLLPAVRVTAAELYEEAFHYLALNQKETGFQNVTPVRLDVLNPESAERFSGLDGIVSNPPYVKAEEIPALQTEVRREPRTALAGGTDGLDFYRAIARYWLPRLRRGGFAAVEVGEGQAPEVKRLFEAAGLSQICVHTDFNGIERVVSGIYC